MSPLEGIQILRTKKMHPMKKLFVFLFVFSALSCTTNRTGLKVPAGESRQVNTPDQKLYTAQVKNQSFRGVDVAVLSKSDGRQVRGFGLSAKGKADVTLESENKLVFKNNGERPVKLRLAMTEAKVPGQADTGTSIRFTLRNKTAKSIPLLIPDVMNPNLSPFSSSGVELAIGQEILFREKGKKYLLLAVDTSMAEGSEIDVAALLKVRRKELGL